MANFDCGGAVFTWCVEQGCATCCGAETAALAVKAYGLKDGAEEIQRLVAEAYERGRAEGYAACMAHVAETAEKIAHAAGGGYDTNIAVATLRRFVGALEASRVGAAQKKGGAT
jgi:hypothetical protein